MNRALALFLLALVTSSAADEVKVQVSKSPLTEDQLAVYKVFLDSYAGEENVKIHVAKRTEPLTSEKGFRLPCLKEVEFPVAPKVHELGPQFKKLHRMNLVGEDFHGEQLWLSEISFDSSGHYAMLQYHQTCGERCSEGGFMVYEKTEGRWKQIREKCPSWTT